MAPPKPVVLIVLDGFGESDNTIGNAVKAANMPYINSYRKNYPFTTLAASEESVGLEKSAMGSSEVGHLILGAGRVIYQMPERIRHAIEEGSFQKNTAFLEVFTHVKKKNSSLHLMGLMSDSGVHSNIKHLFTLMQMAKNADISNVWIHFFGDGRDSPPTSGKYFLTMLEKEMKSLRIGKIATISGRYYAMDRDNRWERTQKAYEAIVHAKGEAAFNATDVFEKAYQKVISDEFILPTVVDSYHGIQDGDGVIFFNFRADRARQLTKALTEHDFREFPATKKDLMFCSMSQYYETQKSLIAFSPLQHRNILPEILSKNKLTQLRAAETEKYAHVTYFFNGGSENVFPGEDRLLVPSAKIATYDLQPEMSAKTIADSVAARIQVGHYDFVLVNFANPDMVGHTGNYEATLEALECVDQCVHTIVKATLDQGGVVLLTADHGNCEHMTDAGQPHTSHTTNLVPCFLISGEDSPWRKVKLRSGSLANMAPTVLKIMEIPLPREMSTPLFP